MQLRQALPWGHSARTNAAAGRALKNRQNVEVVAHRGAMTLADPSRIAPENTLPAFEQAARLGASIELDVIATTDGHLVVHHDDETGRIFRLPGGDKLVRQASFPEIRSAVLNIPKQETSVQTMLGPEPVYRTPDTFRNAQIPELETVLDHLPDTRFYVELKTYDREVKQGLNNNLEERVVRLIQQKNLYDRVTVISFSPASLRRVKQLDPRIRTGLDLDDADMAKQNTLKLAWLAWKVRRWLQADLILPSFKTTNPKLVTIAHKAGIAVAPYASCKDNRAQEEAHQRRMLDMGVDGIVTNAVDSLNRLLSRASDPAIG